MGFPKTNNILILSDSVCDYMALAQRWPEDGLMLMLGWQRRTDYCCYLLNFIINIY